VVAVAADNWEYFVAPDMTDEWARDGWPNGWSVWFNGATHRFMVAGPKIEQQWGPFSSFYAAAEAAESQMETPEDKEKKRIKEEKRKAAIAKSDASWEKKIKKIWGAVDPKMGFDRG
jgi:hypothetical protein